MQRYKYRSANEGNLLIESPTGAWVRYNEADAERARLQAIINKIPKLADGEPAIIGEEVFVRYSNSAIERCVIYCIYAKKVLWTAPDSQGWPGAKLSSVYKTRQAAEQAGITDKKARKELTAAIHDILASYYEETREMDQLRFIVDKYGST